MQKFLQKFKRITYSTSYLPEIDGLRFVAILSVVIILHITNYLDARFYNRQLLSDNYWRRFALEGGHGVTLFFMISGFILSLPFAKWRLKKEKKVSLKYYYLRRLTRLEPPYIIALIIFFIANVWVLHNYSFKKLLPNFFASITYLHNIIYDSSSKVLPVAWSLEVEVQFYVLAPLLFLIFLIPSNAARRTIILLVTVANSLYWFNYWQVGNVFTFLHIFLMGILLADLYCTKTVLIKNKLLGLVIGILSLAGFFFIPSIKLITEHLHFGAGYFAKLICMFLLFHCVLNNAHLKKLFSAQLITIIGGMCYSIYLLHFAIISAAGTILSKANMVTPNQLYFPLYVVFFILLVLIVSSFYFILIEKPFMKPGRFRKK